MPAEWEDYDNRSFLRCGPGEVSVARDPATDKWCAFAFDQPILDAENREAAKAAAEDEARRRAMETLRVLSPDHLGRTDQDFAIEFGGYLATAAERFMEHQNSKEYPTAAEADEGADRWRALQAAIHEFRKRAERAALTAAVGGE